jgi:AraC-like DNA-binding protein
MTGHKLKVTNIDLIALVRYDILGGDIVKADYQNRPWPFKSYHITSYVFSPHLHNQIEVVYVLSGSCIITIENVAYDVVSGDVALIFPYQLHNFSQSKDCELIVQVFEPEYAPEFIPYLDKYIAEIPLLKTLHTDCVDAIKKAEYYYTNGANSRIIRSYVNLYMSFIYEKVNFIVTPVYDYHSVLHSLLIYIDAHFADDLSLDAVARQHHVTKHYISRLFNQKLHTTFTQYIHHLRLEYAVHLLKNTDMTISSIAYESGFECERSFFRVFKESMGSTPLQYRKNR